MTVVNNQYKTINNNINPVVFSTVCRPCDPTEVIREFCSSDFGKYKTISDFKVHFMSHSLRLMILPFCPKQDSSCTSQIFTHLVFNSITKLSLYTHCFHHCFQLWCIPKNIDQNHCTIIWNWKLKILKYAHTAWLSFTRLSSKWWDNISC